MTKSKTKILHPSDRVIVQLALDAVDPPADPMRTNINQDEILELATSIRKSGLLEPVAVAPRGKRYEIIFGHRRYLAHKHLKAATIDAVINDWSDEKIAAARATENINRADVTAVEIAEQFERLQKKHSYTNGTISALTGMSSGFVSEHLKITRYPAQLREALSGNLISFSVARELSRIEDKPTLLNYLHHAIQTGVTPALARRWADDANMTLAQHGVTPELLNDPPQLLEPAVTKRPCYCCEKQKSFAVLSSIWICNTCRGMLTAAFQEGADKA